MFISLLFSGFEVFLGFVILVLVIVGIIVVGCYCLVCLLEGNLVVKYVNDR